MYVAAQLRQCRQARKGSVVVLIGGAYKKANFAGWNGAAAVLLGVEAGGHEVWWMVISCKARGTGQQSGVREGFFC